MPFLDMNDPNNFPDFEPLEAEIKALLTSIAADETKLTNEIQASIEKIKSISGTTSELIENNLASTIATLIQENIKIEQELKDSIKKD